MRSIRWAFLVSTVVVGVTAAATAEADIVFPARLELSEVTRGNYQVTFTLPVLEGRKLRAQPLLPPICRDVTDREVDAMPTAFTTKWQVACEPPSLAGEAILIEGLLGTQTELMVEVKTLDGRLHTAILKPSRPGLIVPSPPSWVVLVGESVLGGMRRMVRFTELWVLVFVATCFGASRVSATLAIVLVMAAAVCWPRRRRVLSELGIERRTSVTHWVLVGLAFFLLPIGTFAARNPFFEPRVPSGEDARRVISQVLWNTYHAFNLTDEDELYDRLSESVTRDLVADLYLDSRRRLTAGTREGAEVTVRDVTVVEVGDKAQGTNAEAGYAYACRWIVTARVRHLQHVHHRQNIYSGNLTIKVDGEKWKIAGVELTSEDRVVLPWKPT